MSRRTVDEWVEVLTDWVDAAPHRTGTEAAKRMRSPAERAAWAWLVGERHVVREVVHTGHRPAHRWTLT